MSEMFLLRLYHDVSSPTHLPFYRYPRHATLIAFPDIYPSPDEWALPLSFHHDPAMR